MWRRWNRKNLHDLSRQHSSFLRLEDNGYCRPVINKPPPLSRECDRDSNIKAQKKKVFINHGSTLLLQ